SSLMPEAPFHIGLQAARFLSSLQPLIPTPGADMTPTKILGLTVLCATALVAGVASAQDVYKIGLVSPLSGANARYGAFANKGANLAAKEINAAGGVLGKKLEFVSGDSQCV